MIHFHAPVKTGHRIIRVTDYDVTPITPPNLATLETSSANQNSAGIDACSVHGLSSTLAKVRGDSAVSIK